MGTHLSNFGYSLTCSSKYTGHESPSFNMEHTSPVGVRCSWSQFFLEMEVKLDSVFMLSLCFFPDSFKSELSKIAEPIWHCLPQWETRALWNFGHCAHMGKGHALRIVTSFFTATPKFISLYLPHIHTPSCHTDFIGTQESDTGHTKQCCCQMYRCMRDLLGRWTGD